MEHERSSNPYDNMDEYFENELDKLRQASGVDMSKRHTDVFKPTNITEFAKYMDVRPRVLTISRLCLGAAAAGLSAIFIYLFFDVNLMLTKYILVYAAVLIALAIFVNKEKSKRAVIAYAVFAIICVLCIFVFASNIWSICHTPDRMILAYLPFAVQCVLGVFLYRCVCEFHEVWEEYQATGVVPHSEHKFAYKAQQIDEWLKYR